MEKKIDVFNLGVGNYNSIQQNLALQRVESKLKPDLVIVLNFVNDAEY